MESLTVESVFAAADTNLMIIGLPDIYKRKSRHSLRFLLIGRIFFWVCYFNVLGTVLCEIVFVFYEIPQVDSLERLLNIVQTFACTTYCVLYFSKTLSIVIYATKLKELMEELTSMWPEDISKSPKIAQGVLVSRRILVIYSRWTSFVISIFNLLPLIITALNTISFVHINYVFQLPYYTIYPFNHERTQTIYFLIYISQGFAGWLTVYGILAVDCLLCAFLALLCTFYQILNDLLEKMADSMENGEEQDELDENEFDDHKEITNESIGDPLKPKISERENIRNMVETHIRLLSAVEKVESLFGFILFLNTLATVLLICLLLFAITISPVARLQNFIGWLISVLVQIFTICYYGNLLMEESGRTSLSAYCSKWPSATKNVKFLILMIQLRSHEGTCINCLGFMKLSLETFCSIINMSWSYFTLIRTVTENIQFS